MLPASRNAVVVETEPSNPTVHYSLGVSLAAMSRWEEAIASFAEATRLEPDAPDIAARLGVTYAEAGQPARATVWLEKAVRLEPSRDNYLNLGVNLHELGRTEEAQTALEKVLSMAPGSRDIIILLAGVLASREKHAQALKVLESLDEEDVDGLVARSQVLLKLGRIQDALAAARSAVGKAPGNAEGHASLGFVFLRAGDSVQAVREFDLALRMCPERAEFKAGRACALSLAGRHADALEVFRQLDRDLPTIFSADPELRPYYERSVSETAQWDP